MAGGFYKLLLCKFVLQIGEGGFDAGVIDQILVALLVAGEVVTNEAKAQGAEQSIAVLLPVCWNAVSSEWSRKEGGKTMITNALSAEAVRIQNGSNHHLLKFALIRSLLTTGSRFWRLVSILSCIHPLLCSTLRSPMRRKNGAHPPLRARRAKSYIYSAPYAKRPAEHSTAHAY